MAKKKVSNKSARRQLGKISPEKFMREKVRTLPIGKCYVTPGWKDVGIADVIVTRIRRDGNLVVVSFLVDTFCLGVKNASYKVDMAEDQLAEFLRESDHEEVSYEEAHNIIYGAIAFAEEGGIEPAKSFATACRILEEDTDDVPLIEYEFGSEGKHLLVVDDDRNELRYVGTLREHLGEENFKVVMPLDDDDDYEEDDDDYNPFVDDELLRYPFEKYSYEYPEYPSELTVKHQFIADAFLSPEYEGNLPTDVIDRILALPAAEVVADINNIVFYVIGQTYKAINDGTAGEPTHSAIIHALLFLTQLGNEAGLGAVLEIMHQNDDFVEYHFGDTAPEFVPQALYACGRNNVAAIEAYLYEKGLDTYMRGFAVTALATIIALHPERRSEIIEVLRKYLVALVDRIPSQAGCDAHAAGLMICDLVDIGAVELLPEIKALYEADCITVGIPGSFKSVAKDIQHAEKSSTAYKIPDIHQRYERIRRWFIPTSARGEQR